MGSFFFWGGGHTHFPILPESPPALKISPEFAQIFPNTARINICIFFGGGGGGTVPLPPPPPPPPSPWYAYMMQGRIFIYGGVKDYYTVRTRTSQDSAKPEDPYGRGPRPWKLSWFLIPFRAIWAKFLSILIQNGIKERKKT